MAAHRFARAKSTSPAKVIIGIGDAPVWWIVSPCERAWAASPARSRSPAAVIGCTAPSSRMVLIVAIAAAIATAANQNEPVTQIFDACSRKRSLPSTPARGWPLAIALPHALRSGLTPSGSQLLPLARRKPHRTSSRMRAASCSSQALRMSRAKVGSTSS